MTPEQEKKLHDLFSEKLKQEHCYNTTCKSSDCLECVMLNDPEPSSLDTLIGAIVEEMIKYGKEVRDKAYWLWREDYSKGYRIRYMELPEINNQKESE